MKRFFLICACLLCLLPAARAQDGEIAAYVNGRPVLESQLEERLKNTQWMNALVAEELTDEQLREREESARREALDALAAEEALLEEAEKRGLTLERDAIRADADQRYEQMIAMVESYALSAYSSLEGEALAQQVDALLAASGASREQYREVAQRSAILAALDEALAQELPAPDEAAVAARYEALYEAQKAEFDADENAFEAAMLGGETVVHRPVTLKLIQKAEFLFDSGASALIWQTAAMNEEAAEEMRNDQYRKLDARVEAALEALAGGEKTFADIMEECKAGSSETVNYFHESSTRFNEDYYQRAAAFEEVGEVSAPYAMTNGYALLYYAGDLPACDRVPLEEVRARIAEEMAQESRSEQLAQARAAIVEAAVIEVVEP